MEGPISFWGYKEQQSNLILHEHDDDDDDDDQSESLRVHISVQEEVIMNSTSPTFQLIQENVATLNF
jgi:hypothetical protein